MRTDEAPLNTDTQLSGKRYSIQRGSELYPEALEQIDDPPDRLYVVGSPQLLSEPALAIVGARKATPYGKGCAERFAKRTAQSDVTVVSGGAIGCDQSAHRGALEAGGVTIVVLGCGADVVYPTRARSLFEQIVCSGGCLVSELPWGSPPLRWAFVKRNRLIAALSQAVLIVEAGLPSGTFSTADAALQQGKEVWVVPGSIDSRQSRGSNRLLLQGAVPIVDGECFSDLLSATFGSLFPKTMIVARQEGARNDAYARFTGTDDVRIELIAALEATPSRPEALVGIRGLSITEVIQQLSALEVNGYVERLCDGRYALRTANPAANRYYGSHH